MHSTNTARQERIAVIWSHNKYKVHPRRSSLLQCKPIAKGRRKIVFILSVHTITYARQFWMRELIQFIDDEGKRFRKGKKKAAIREYRREYRKVLMTGIGTEGEAT